MFYVIGLAYLDTLFPLTLPYAKPAGVWLVKIFIVVSYLGYFGFLALVPLVILMPLALLLPRKFVISLTVLLYAALAFTLIVDSQVFVLYRFHLNTAILHLVFSGHAGEIFEFSKVEWLSIGAIALALLGLESLFAWIISYKWQQGLHWERRCGYTIFACLVLSLFVVLYSMDMGINVYSQQTKALPLYNQVLAELLPINNSLNVIDRFAEGEFTQIQQATGKLHYPLQPLQCHAAAKPKNIILIIVDTWRANTVTPRLMPNTFKFSQQALQFTHHYSGGNATQSGIFSLFYALPSTYWTSMLRAQQGPVFIRELQAQGYQMGIFHSAEISVPNFRDTVFRDIKGLPNDVPGEVPSQRDRTVAQQFTQFINQANPQQPLFAVVYYNTAHAYCMDPDYSQPFQPAIKTCNRISRRRKTKATPYLNRYYNALHFIDQLIGQNLQVLRDQQRLKNSVIIITSDHGQEFNDTQRNYWEHASNFTRYQLQTPLLISWPGKKPRQLTYFTSHYDLVPTLMAKLLNCTNPYSDYSLGLGLFNDELRKFLVVASYANFGVVTPDTITTFYPSGNITIQDSDAKPLLDARPDFMILRQALAQTRQFYRN